MMSAIDSLWKAWGCKTATTNAESVIVPRAILERLTMLAFNRTLLDEQSYLETHRDVKEAVERLAFLSGTQHYQWIGILEGRTLEDKLVDPEKYRALNKDLASDANQEAATEHWRSVGWLEGRLTS